MMTGVHIVVEIETGAGHVKGIGGGTEMSMTTETDLDTEAIDM